MGKYKEGLAPSQDRIRRVMKGGRKWWKPWQIQTILNLQGGHKRLSESTITRDLRRMQDTINRPCHNDSWDYSLIKGAK